MVREDSLKFADIRQVSVGAAEVLQGSPTFSQIGPDSPRPVRSMAVRSALLRFAEVLAKVQFCQGTPRFFGCSVSISEILPIDLQVLSGSRISQGLSGCLRSAIKLP